MHLLQLSAGQGPDECARAVWLAARRLEAEASERGLTLAALESVPGNVPQSLKSLLLAVQGEGAQAFCETWQGPMLWHCESGLRPGHRRKNWYFSGQLFVAQEAVFDDAITFKATKAGGPGGQHVNKTESAIQATHRQSGISVWVASERSQHANKRLARALIAHKLAALAAAQQSAEEQARWQQHQALERGNPRRRFYGPDFVAR